MRDLVAICDTQSVYARRLTEYISDKTGERYEVRLYTSFGLMNSALDGKVVSVLLICQERFDELIQNENNLQFTVDVVGLLDNSLEKSFEESRETGIGNRLLKINRFQSAENIMKILLGESLGRNQIMNISAGVEGDEFLNAVKIGDKCLNSEYLCEEYIDRDYSERLKAIRSLVKRRVQEVLLTHGMLSDNDTLVIIDECIEEYSDKIREAKISSKDRKGLRNGIFYAIRGLDVLEELISDESITEIMVNGENHIFYEQNGKIYNSGKSFDSREILLDIIRKIVSDANRTVNMSSPIVDARLKNGSRVNAVLEPVSLDGPILTIRRFPKEPLSADKLVAMGAVSEEIMELLRRLVYSGYNILVSGGTGSGKTTFLNILSGFIPKDERIITIEDSAELKIMGIDNLVRLESRNANVDGCNEITIRDLIKSALRMRPDRIIVGECRGAEAIDMLQSFLVGQDGSMSTIHANSAEDALYRLEMLMMINGSDMPLNALRRQIAAGVDIIIQLVRLKDKSRKLLEIREVTGFIDGEIKTSLVYKYEEGEFVKHGEIYNKYKLEMAGF